MGYALAQEAVDRGADVLLISGPTNLTVPKGVEVEYITTSEEMYTKVMKNYLAADIIIKSAAVADYRPKDISKEKLKSLATN